MKNTYRSQAYIEISHKIKACSTLPKLREALPFTIRFINEADDKESHEIIDLYYEKEKELDVTIDHFPFPVALFGNNVCKLKTI